MFIVQLDMFAPENIPMWFCLYVCMSVVYFEYFATYFEVEGHCFEIDGCHWVTLLLVEFLDF